jgi:hypothetical protein
MKLFNRILLAFKLFYFGFCHPDFLTERVFVVMAKFFELALMVVNKDKPFTTHLYMGEKRVVSFWMYPGLSKNPVDRIAELLSEVEALKEAAQHPTTAV